MALRHQPRTSRCEHCHLEILRGAKHECAGRKTERLRAEALAHLPRVALTLIQPWATLIIEFGKDIENRGWAPKLSQLKPGGRFFVHAGREPSRGDYQHACDIVPDFARAYPTIERVPRSAILGDVRFGGAVTGSQSRWWNGGPVGWCLSEPAKLARPVSCSGALGLWRVPEDVLAQIAGVARG